MKKSILSILTLLIPLLPVPTLAQDTPLSTTEIITQNINNAKIPLISFSDYNWCRTIFVTPENSAFFPEGTCKSLEIGKVPPDTSTKAQGKQLEAIFLSVMQESGFKEIALPEKVTQGAQYKEFKKDKESCFFLLDEESSTAEKNYGSYGCSTKLEEEMKLTTPLLKTLHSFNKGKGIARSQEDVYPYMLVSLEVPFTGGGSSYLLKSNTSGKYERILGPFISLGEIPCEVLNNLGIPGYVHKQTACTELSFPASTKVQEFVEHMNDTLLASIPDGISGGTYTTTFTLSLKHHVLPVRGVALSIDIPLQVEEPGVGKKFFSIIKKTEEYLNKEGFTLDTENTDHRERGRAFYSSAWKKDNTNCLLTTDLEDTAHKTLYLSCTDTLRQTYRAYIPYFLTFGKSYIHILYKESSYIVLALGRFEKTTPWAILKKVGARYETVFDSWTDTFGTNEMPSCKLMKERNIPKSVYWECVEE